MPKYQRLEYDELSPSLQNVLPPDMPLPQRIAAAKGLIPLGTRDLLSALFYLSGDSDKQVAVEAKRNLRDLPESLTLVGISGDISPKLLHYIGTRNYDNHHIYQKIALHRRVQDQTLAWQAENVAHEGVLEIIGRNESAILRHPQILHGLTRNPIVPKAMIERLKKFYELEKGSSYLDDLPLEVKEAPPPPPPPPPPDPAEELKTPQDVIDFMANLPDERIHPCVQLSELLSLDIDVEELFADDLVQDQPVGEEGPKHISVIQRIARLSMIDKLLLAMKGNYESRKFLLRNPNKLIQEAVLINPRITVQEIVHAAKERSTSQAVIEKICNNREWTRYREVTLSLCFHPKTPVRFIYRALSGLPEKDLQNLAKNRNVSSSTRQQAQRMLIQRGKRR